jgi:hypothetical protein
MVKGDVMADNLEHSDRWRDEIEGRVSMLESTVGEQARLRAVMDEDLSRLHVERDLLQALHDTQSDHTRLLTKLGAEQEELRQELRTGFERVHVGVEAIRDLLNRNLSGGDR